MEYIHRHIEKKVKELFDTYKVVLITGARQVGKTRLINEMFKKIKYINLDDYEKENMARSDGKRFLNDEGMPLMIDEVQRVPELFRIIKLFVDKSEAYGQYILSGSQLFKLMNEASDSLSGRIAILELPTLSTREMIKISFDEVFLPNDEYINKRKKIKLSNNIDLWKIIFEGSYPERQYDKKSKEDFYSNYVRTYIERDVRDIVNVQNLDLFYKFMVSVAARTGQLINYSNIASDIGVDADTIKKWISVLETSNIIYILQPYANKELKRVLKTPKMYFRDTGLCSHLLRWSSKETLMNGAMNGAMFETYVVSEIIKSYTNKGLDYKRYISFYNGRDNRKGTQGEIDLLIENDNVLYPIEIKLKSNPDIHDIENFALLDKIKDKIIGNGAVICRASGVGFINDKCRVIPVSYI